MSKAEAGRIGVVMLSGTFVVGVAVGGVVFGVRGTAGMVVGLIAVGVVLTIGALLAIGARAPSLGDDG